MSNIDFKPMRPPTEW